MTSLVFTICIPAFKIVLLVPLDQVSIFHYTLQPLNSLILRDFIKLLSIQLVEF